MTTCVIVMLSLIYMYYDILILHVLICFMTEAMYS